MLEVPSARPMDRGKEEAEEKPAQGRQIVLVFQGGGALGAYQAGGTNPASSPIGSSARRLAPSTPA